MLDLWREECGPDEKLRIIPGKTPAPTSPNEWNESRLRPGEAAPIFQRNRNHENGAAMIRGPVALRYAGQPPGEALHGVAGEPAAWSYVGSLGVFGSGISVLKSAASPARARFTNCSTVIAWVGRPFSVRMISAQASFSRKT